MKLTTASLVPLLILVSSTTPQLFAAPTITSVMNAAGNINPALPNGALAPGSIFIVKGNGLGPANISIAPNPFKSTTLSGTSVAVTIGTTTVNALMYYTSATQIAALMPSNAPAGTGAASNIVVTYNSQSSPSTPFRGVAVSSVHIFTFDSTGQGQAIVTYPDYSLVSGFKGTPCGGPNTACGAANPGDILILWATGLGAISGDDASGAGLGQNMPNIPLKLWLGGVEATVSYQGRSGCCIGEDQIVFTVPANAPTGCAVPLVIQVNNQISNSTVMPVARGSRNCTITGFTSEFSPLANPLSFAFGDVGLSKNFNNSGSGQNDSAYFEFDRIGLQPGIAPFLPTGLDSDSTPLGTCTVRDDSNPGNEEFGLTGFASLDGGSSIRLTGPNGNATVNSGGDTTISGAGTFLAPSSYTVTGTGGKDVGPFSATLTIPSLPVLTGPVSGNTVNRVAGMTFTWTGGSGGTVAIQVTSGPDAFPTVTATARCGALASAGTFTIPPYVLLALPASSNARFFFGINAPNGTFTATGIDFGNFHVNISRSGGSLKLQ